MYQILGLYRFSFGQGVRVTQTHPPTNSYTRSYIEITTACCARYVDSKKHAMIIPRVENEKQMNKETNLNVNN